MNISQAWRHAPVLLATQEIEAGGLQIQGITELLSYLKTSLGNLSETLSQTKKYFKKWGWGRGLWEYKSVTVCLPDMFENLVSIPNII